MKARTSTKKKRGRPCLPATDTQPNGQPSRRRASVAALEIINKRVAMEARIRFYGAAETDCERQEWGYLLGRLYLMAKIGMKSRQHEAGVRMAQDYARYFGLCHIQQPNARALDLFRVHGRAGDGDQEAAEKAKQRHDQIERLLVPNSAVSNVTTAVCVYEHHMTGYYGTALLAGLTRLADFYGIPVDDSQAT